MQNLTQILFVMWRETVEAMLVVGILHAWLSHDAQGKAGIKYLWLGVLIGLVGACLLGLGIEALNAVLSDDGQEYFQAGLQLAAAALIVQMVFWMRRHGRSLKRDMERSLGLHTQLALSKINPQSTLASNLELLRKSEVPVEPLVSRTCAGREPTRQHGVGRQDRPGCFAPAFPCSL